MRRTKTSKRARFTREEKEAILTKTKGRCAHCGRDISVDVMTVEHAVPISRGGSNEDVNIVPLCSDCNTSKGFKVINPYDYYRFLRKNAMSELVEYFGKYCDSVDWFYNQNIFQYDVLKFDVQKVVMGQKRKPIFSKVNVTVERAWYSDLDDIYYFLLNYAQEYLDEDFITNLKACMSNTFENGCFYMIRSKSSGKILAVFDIGYKPDVVGKSSNIVLYEYGIGMYIYIDPSIPMSLNVARFKEYSNYSYYSTVVTRLLWEIAYHLNKMDDAKGSLLPLSIKYRGTKDKRVLKVGLCGIHADERASMGIDLNSISLKEVEELSRVGIYTMGIDKGVSNTIECQSDEEMLEYRLKGQKFLESNMSARFKSEMNSLIPNGVRVSQVIEEHNNMSDGEESKYGVKVRCNVEKVV